MYVIDGRTIREEIKSEYNKIKAMNAQNRWEYYKSYYLWKTVLFLFFTIAIISMIRSFSLSRRPVFVEGAAINVHFNDEGEELLSNGCITHLEKKENQMQAIFSDEWDIEFGSDYEYYNAQYMEALYADISVKKLDYLILDEESAKYFLEQGYTEEITDITNSKLAKEYGQANKEYYYITLINSERKEAAKTVLAYIVDD